jgi:phosphodiesterase/alkaline phosphatase D-like protein
LTLEQTVIAMRVLIFLLLSVAAFAQTLKITKGPVVEHAGATNAEIAWSTNESSATVVRYGTDRDHLDEKAEMPWGALTHRVTLKKLRPGTTYYFQADSEHGAQSEVGTFNTSGGSAHAQPVANHPELKITTGPVLENVSETTATVAWTTSLPSSSIVRYGLDAGHLDQRAEEAWGATTHRVQLKNLRPHTRYFYSVHSAQGKDAPGQVQDTQPQEFRTGGDDHSRR